MRTLWTDGGASPNPGNGGWAVIEQKGSKFAPLAYGGKPDTTNIRMEGRAIAEAFRQLNGQPGEIKTDSKFWIDVLTEWAPSWEQRNWTKPKGEIANLDIVKTVYQLYKDSKAKLIWVKGHDGIEGNEIADEYVHRGRAEALCQEGES